MLDCKEGRLFDAQESRIKTANVQKWQVPSHKRFDLLKLKNRVYRMRNVEKWEVSSCNEVELQMLRNRIFRLRNYQVWAVPFCKESICYFSEIAF